MQTVHYILGTILIISSLLKIVDLKRFAEVYSKYDVVAGSSKLYARAYPLVELALGLLYFIYPREAFLSFVTILIVCLSLYSLAQRYNRRQNLNYSLNESLIVVPLPMFTALEGVVMTLLALVILFTF